LIANTIALNVKERGKCIEILAAVPKNFSSQKHSFLCVQTSIYARN